MHSYSKPDKTPPHYYVVPAGDIIDDFLHRWIHVLQQHQGGDPAYIQPNMPDVSKIVHEALQCLKNAADAEMDISIFAYRDIQAMVLYNVQPSGVQWSYSLILTIANALAAEAELFGLRLYRQLKQLGFYQSGYFPYHFCGLIGRDIVVGLDGSHGGYDEVSIDLKLVTY